MFKDVLKSLRKSKGLTQEQLAQIILVERSSIGKYESRNIIPSVDVLNRIANYFGVSVDYLLGREESVALPDNIIPMPKMRKIPLLGTVACGEPILAVENLDGEVSIPDDIRADFALRCKGDSMTGARIFDGDIVYIRQQPDVDNGQIAAVLIDAEATLKYVYKFNDHIILQPANVAYNPLVYWYNDMNNLRILGRVVGFTSVKV